MISLSHPLLSMHSIRTAEWGPGGFLQNYCVIRAKFVIICVLYCRVAFVGIQPERLNAEGFSPSALSRGWSVSATPGVPAIIVKASGRRESSCQRSRYSRSSHHVGWHDTEGYASLHPRLRATRSARAFDLSGRVAGGFNTDFHGIERISTDYFGPAG